MLEQMTDDEMMERQQIAATLATKKDEQVLLCATACKARGETDWEGCSARTTRARAGLAKSRGQHRLEPFPRWDKKFHDTNY